MRVGVLAVQGDFEAHAKMLEKMGVPFIYVTHPKHLSGINGLIIPGGESTTMLKFLAEDNFINALKEFADVGRCLFGSCAGAILLASEVTNPFQQSLDLLDITIKRNAYGRQLASQIKQGTYDIAAKTIEMVFIRAPRIVRVGPGVKVFATCEGEPVGVMQEQLMLTTFHPELTNDQSIHQLFIEKCTQSIGLNK